MPVYIRHIETFVPENAYSKDLFREKMMSWPDRTMAQFVEPAGAVPIPAPLNRISPQETACI